MERITRHLSYANIMATVAVVFAMTGGAIAATGGFTPGGKLQACVNEEGGIKLLKAGKHCKRGQKTVAWNQVGPTGARGATGVAGASGAAGVTGAPGSTGAAGGAPTAWARISESGSLVAGQGVVKAEKSELQYIVQFDRDVTKCGAVATLSGGAVAHHVASALVEPPSAVFIVVDDGGGAPTAGRFTLALYC